MNLTKILKILFFSVIFLSQTKAQNPKIINRNTFIIKNKLKKINTDFIVICTREINSDGRYYYIDQDQTVVYSGIIASGAPQYKTPYGSYKVYYKKRYHMSTKYPEPSGINNMDYSLFFNKGIALHQGNENAYSHGCIHLNKKDATLLFKLIKNGTRVIVLKGNYNKVLSKNERSYLLR